MTHLHGLSVDQRIDQLLAQRAAGSQLDALGKLSLKKIGKKLKKLVKKVAPIAIGGAALYFGAGALRKKGKGKKGKAGRVAASVANGEVQVAVPLAQAAAATAISAGALPVQSGELQSQEQLLATATQIARAELAQQGVDMRSPAAQDIVRQAVHEAGGAAAGGAADGFDFGKAWPWLAGGGLVLAVAMSMGARRAR